MKVFLLWLSGLNPYIVVETVKWWKLKVENKINEWRSSKSISR